MDEQRWYYLADGEQKGPVERAALVALLRNGTLPPDTNVWQEGTPDWRPARDVVGLGSAPPKAPVPASTGKGVRMILPGPLASHRAYLAGELPELVYQAHMAAQLGGQP